MPVASVGPTAENLMYGDAAMQTSKRHLSAAQFSKIDVPTPSIDGGWLGPEGSYGEPSSSGSLYGYGVPSDYPQY